MRLRHMIEASLKFDLQNNVCPFIQPVQRYEGSTYTPIFQIYKWFKRIQLGGLRLCQDDQSPNKVVRASR